MNPLHIVEADFSNKKHTEAILRVTDSYARDPMGIGEPLASGIKNRLINEMRNFPGTFSFIAFVDDKPAGVANCIYSFSTFKASKVINIHDLVVMPGYRGQGIGDALMTAAEEKAKEMNCCKITLEVREDNRARNLYQRKGFSCGEPKMFFMEKEL